MMYRETGLPPIPEIQKAFQKIAPYFSETFQTIAEWSNPADTLQTCLYLHSYLGKEATPFICAILLATGTSGAGITNSNYRKLRKDFGQKVMNTASEIQHIISPPPQQPPETIHEHIAYALTETENRDIKTCFLATTNTYVQRTAPLMKSAQIPLARKATILEHNIQYATWIKDCCELKTPQGNPQIKLDLAFNIMIAKRASQHINNILNSIRICQGQPPEFPLNGKDVHKRSLH